MVRRAIEEKWGREMQEFPPREVEQRRLEDMPGYQGAFNRLHYRFFPVASNPVLEWIASEVERGTSPDEIAAALRFILAAPAMTGQMIALDGGQHLGWAQPDQTPLVE